MLKICKHMQNIQNMHSCFKNAAFCTSRRYHHDRVTTPVLMRYHSRATALPPLARYQLSVMRYH